MHHPRSMNLHASSTPLVATLALLFGSALLAVPVQAQWTATVLHPAGAISSVCNDVQDGQQVGYADFGNNSEAALWAGTAASFTNLHPGGGYISWARGVQGGRQAGQYYPVSDSHAAVWTGTAGSLVDLNPAGATDSNAFDIEGNQVVGEARIGPTTKASLWSALSGNWTDMHPLGAPFPVFSSRINATDGSQQAGQAGAGILMAIMWGGTANSYVFLHPAAAASSQALGVHAGQQVGRATFGFSSHAALWTGSVGSYVDLNPAGMQTSTATAVHQGEQVGYSADSSQTTHAGLWTGSAASWTDLHGYLPASFSGSLALGIWHAPDGTTYVVGQANEPGSHPRAVMWMKAPPVWTNLGFALAGAGGTPSLVGSGTLATASGGSLTLSNAAPSAISMLFTSLSGNPTPFKGGLLVPLPAILTLALATSAGGSIALPWPSWPAGLSGLGIHFQFGIQDAGGPQGVALSNALRGNVP